jgi:hypothetical protein
LKVEFGTDYFQKTTTNPGLVKALIIFCYPCETQAGSDLQKQQQTNLLNQSLFRPCFYPIAH